MISVERPDISSELPFGKIPDHPVLGLLSHHTEWKLGDRADMVWDLERTRQVVVTGYVVEMQKGTVQIRYEVSTVQSIQRCLTDYGRIVWAELTTFTLDGQDLKLVHNPIGF